ncbi:hypothetical protein MFLAVUS_008555 [Mucor flavus]|uniref:Uncharacterized protein n=1 Tax=Mucor flavus TaxID=439312 RepID=A0ABP9Z7I0_9FUNG
MTNKSSSNNQFTNDFIIDDQDEVNSPEPVYASEGFGGINQDFRQDTTFIVDIESDSKQPGTLTGEQCPMSDLVNNSYDYLSTQYPHWRRMLSDEYMRDTKLDHTTTTHEKLKTAQLVMLHIDDHAWASIVHYLTASKFISQTEFYHALSLDSGNGTSRLTAAEVKQLARSKSDLLSKEQEKDWYENRKVEAWRRALLAKFAQNEDLQRALILTGWAKLVDKQGRVQHLLMWVRAVLRGDQKETTSDVIPKSVVKEDTNPKSVDEVLRVIEGLFGKDKQHVLSSILSAQQQQKKVVEPKVVEMKDAVGYLEQIKTDEPPQTYNKFLAIMTDFRSEKINTPQVLERVTLLFKGKPWLIRNFLMFLPPGHILDLSPENKLNSIYITSPTGKKIIINTDEGKVLFE